MKLRRDAASLQVEHQSNGRRMKWGLTQVDSNTAAMLPLFFDLFLGFQCVIKNITGHRNGIQALGFDITFEPLKTSHGALLSHLVGASL
jgi:hypothetical protein